MRGKLLNQFFLRVFLKKYSILLVIYIIGVAYSTPKVKIM